MDESSPDSQSPPPKPGPSKVTMVTRPTNGRQTSGSLWQWAFAFAPIFLIIYAVQQVPREIGRWYRVAALEKWNHGQHDEARQAIKDSLRWSANSIYADRFLSEFSKDEKDYPQALEHLDKCIAALPQENLFLQIERAELLQLNDRFEEAVAIWKKVDSQSQASGIIGRDVALNGLAYARAVGKMELPEALVAIDSAIKIQQDFPSDNLDLSEADKSTSETSSKKRTANPMLIDTRGYILFQLGRYEEALKEMDLAISLYEDSGFVRKVRDQKKQLAAENKAPRLQAPETDSAETDFKSMAVIFHHRALVLKALGKDRLSEQDTSIVRELYGEPDKSLF